MFFCLKIYASKRKSYKGDREKGLLVLSYYGVRPGIVVLSKNVFGVKNVLEIQ
jgi:hypothetical protein